MAAFVSDLPYGIEYFQIVRNIKYRDAIIQVIMGDKPTRIVLPFVKRNIKTNDMGYD